MQLATAGTVRQRRMVGLWQHGLTMAKSAPATGRPAWLKDLNSFLVSAVCHLAALVSLGLLTVAAGRGWQPVVLLAQLGDGHDLPGDDAPLDALVQFEAARTDDSAAARPEPLLALAPATMSDIASAGSLLSISDVSGGLDGLGISDMGDRLGGRLQGATQFFGLGGSGNSFVYVVDCSDSMNESRKFERARYELLQSIEQLGDDQRYFVIFYNDGAYPMDADKPVPATPDQFERTRRWIDRVVPCGGTHPLPALLYALSLKPDAIYFLSDGLFDPGAIVQVRVRNSPRRARAAGGSARGDQPHSGRVPIHTIAFVNREARGLMRTIARQSGGQFRFVP